MSDPNPYAQFAPAPAPALTDDNSDWSHPNPTENPYAQYATAPPAAAPADKGQPVWSSSPLSLAPMSQYADGSYGFDSNAGMLGAAKRMGKSALGTIENLPNLYHQVGAETANNTTTPQTAGQGWRSCGPHRNEAGRNNHR